MVVIEVQRYVLVDHGPDGGIEEPLFTFTAEPGKIEQFRRDLNDTFTTDRYEIREYDECVHDWRGVARVDEGWPVDALRVIEQCPRCDGYRYREIASESIDGIDADTGSAEEEE